MSIVDAQGVAVAAYHYDPYGNLISASGTMAETNPLRYRGYYYDTESGLYYLQSRYYDPEVGRFINADSLASTGQGILGFNMFTYCLNNPVISVDKTGKRTYFINGISNDEEDDAPDYAYDFAEKLEALGVDDVIPIPVYKGQTDVISTILGGIQVICEFRCVSHTCTDF